MVKKYFLFFLIILPFQMTAQSSLNGVWQGVIIPAGKTMKEASIFWLTIEGKSSSVTAISRTEIVKSPYYALKKVKGNQKDSTLDLQEIVLYKKESAPGLNWCKLTYELTYNSKTGYLSGPYNSTECRRTIGQVILFSSDQSFSEAESSPMAVNWFNKFVEDYQKGRNAPKIREKERDKFAFTPLYFDYDKAEIRQEYFAYLQKMVDIVNDQSDLRIKVTGNTDADGTDEYNVGLSQRRAEAIVNFFVQYGLKRDKIELDFKGEMNPVDDNTTEEGRQRNRRVEFSFIF
jgi:outer membrane protein OmpA-like peptidoglycan-associated protein